ncbi:MAG TPA: phage holin family protein [Candidatus Limnocylindrales bacterium]|nr:phage holin family protein [Candidatus Limnocylindrales bacterium]
MDETRDERSLGQLFGDLSRQLGTLVRKEIELARTEMTTRATAVGRDAAMLGAGTAALYAAFLGLMFAAVLLLIDAGLTPWMAALLVAIVVGIIGGALVARGRAALQQSEMAPRATIDTLRDDADWAKERIK